MFHDNAPLTPQDVEDGTYFRKARQWYSDMYHYPVTERSYYFIIIFLSLVISMYGVQSFYGIFPLSVKIPFLVYSNDAWVDLPIAKKIAIDPREDKNDAVMRYMVEDYVVNRESYDLERYELRYRNIASESTRGVFEKYKESMEATNLYSPYRIYTNRFKRVINMTSYSFERGEKESRAVVDFYASVLNVFDGQEVKRGKYRAEITYHYVNFSIDQSLDSYVWIAHLFHLTGDTIKASGEKRKVIPMKFVVSDYKVKELLE